MKFIPLDTVLAEIEKRKRQNLLNEGAFEEDIDILSFINTLEVKEVDLDREMQAFASLYLEPLKISDSNIGISITMKQLYSCAKHFFRLGLNASNPLTDANLDSMQDDYVSLLESRGMKHEEAVIASASYANGVNDVLKRFKAQKGE